MENFNMVYNTNFVSRLGMGKEMHSLGEKPETFEQHNVTKIDRGPH